MRALVRKSTTPLGMIIIACLVFAFLGAILYITTARADDGQQTRGGRLVTIHDRGEEKVILTHAGTIQAALEEANVNLDAKDTVEPGLDEKLVATDYTVNIYRARPVIVNDGAIRQKIMTAYQTADKIAQDAGITLHDEDKTTLTATDDIVAEGASVRLVIERATPITLILYGKKTQAYTQAKTVGEMLSSKKVTLAQDDTLSVDRKTVITSGMTIELWRNGKQTVTEDQNIAFEVEKIQDADREVGYREVKTPGEKGKRTVSYEIEMRNGQELSRKEIQSVVTQAPKKQVEIVGAKPSFSGDFAAALAKLRSCEGGYNSWNPAGYYGAYQFDRQTWGTVADPALYRNATPAQQDEAAHKLYLRRGWSPWPNCGKPLPDIYR